MSLLGDLVTQRDSIDAHSLVDAGEEAGCVVVPVIMVDGGNATAEARQLFKPLEGDSQHNAAREHSAAPSSQPVQAGGHKSQPRRSRKTTKGVTPQLQLVDAPVPQEQGPAQQPQACTKAAAGKRKRETAERAKGSKRNKAVQPKDPNCQAAPTHSAQQARTAQGRVTRSAAAKQPEPSSRRMTRAQGRAGQKDHPAAKQPEPSSSRLTRSRGRAEQSAHPAAKQPEPSSSRMTRSQGRAKQGSEPPAPLAQGNAHLVAYDAEATGESKRRRGKRGEAGRTAVASSAAQRRLPQVPAAAAPSRGSQPPPDASGRSQESSCIQVAAALARN